jgi:hypothetical protein
MSDKPAAWYYVGEGRLRYRDDYGWTEFYLDASEQAGMSWPPPAPGEVLRELEIAEASQTSEAMRLARKRSLFGRRSRVTH